MLMPILTVKTAAVTAQAAAVVETVTPKEQRTSSLPLRISGNQSEAVLKILETLNRHLIGSEPLPKEALIRLLDTLAKILKFPPLPQETLRDFTKRLAGFLETLPPAARLVLEKQLGQRDLAVSLRILGEALKGSSIIDAPRLLDRFLAPTTGARPAINQPAATQPLITQPGKGPAAALPVQQGQIAAPGRQQMVPATGQPLLTASLAVPDPGLLQAALRKAFGDGEEIRPMAGATDEGEALNDLTVATKSEGQRVKSQMPRGGEAAAAGAQPALTAKGNIDSIPLLRAAAAFLATDPEALSLVAAIATGDIDSQTRTELELQLGIDLSEHGENMPQAEIAAEQTEPFDLEADTGTDTRPSTGRQQDGIKQIEVEGFKGHDLGEWQLETEADRQPLPSAPETFASASAQEQPEKVLAQTLKALVEATQPLPGDAESVVPDALFSALAGETGDLGAEALFAELEISDEAAMLADTVLLTGDAAEQPDFNALEDEAWSSMLKAPEDRAASRLPLAHSPAMEEAARDAQIPRQPDAVLARDVIPFAMIPYLPAKIETTQNLKQEEDEQAAFEEEREDGGESGDEPDEREGPATPPLAETDEGEAETADAYDLYRRMGGLG